MGYRFWNRVLAPNDWRLVRPRRTIDGMKALNDKVKFEIHDGCLASTIDRRTVVAGLKVTEDGFWVLVAYMQVLAYYSSPFPNIPPLQ
jgi:hypothetical protein